MSEEIDPRLFGWRGEIAEQEYSRLAKSFAPWVCEGGMAEPGPPIWEAAKELNDGKHLPTWYQQTGDCVSMGASQAGQYLHCYEIARLRHEEKFRFWFPPYIYATSRIDVGRGGLGRGAGSTGAWAAEAMMKYGVLFSDDEGVPDYSGSLADSWGYRGAPAEFKALAKDNPVKQASRLSTSDQIRTALINYNPCTYAITWVYGQGATEYKGYRTLSRGRGGGGHQVCLLAWMDEPFEAAFLLNSWSANVHKGVDNGEPPGGAWLLRKDLERDLNTGAIEVYSLSGFSGTAGEPWHGVFGR